MFIDIACAQLKKHKQNAFGDYFLSQRIPEENRLLAVLSDGLGSGIKASILAKMTATMLLRSIAKNIEIKKAAEIMLNSLPVCKVRGISYATFSVIDCDEDGNVSVVEEGNPDFLLLRGGRVQPIEHHEIVSKTQPDRKLRTYHFKTELGDRLIFCSDGVTQAGLGNNPAYPRGFGKDGLLAKLQDALTADQTMASGDLAKFIAQSAAQVEPHSQPKDDISACVVYFRNPREALIFTGPPYDQEKDTYYAILFAEFSGKKIICGGTTANIISRELDRPVVTEPGEQSGSLPPSASMPGVDLITEGILTLTRALEYLEKGQLEEKDAAGQLVALILQTDVLHFLLGAKINQAHYDPALPIEIEIRRNIVKKIAAILGSKYFKKVNIQCI
ncbi:serine phosphatase [Candidatus Termititenax persephonae]|uniref:Serine phosphatase n=1 Tax=Candidatus Termititenax persephonae TaxID=2218525 RepID=A0A388TEJ5_9BACT|nr:serine phosphatase [Candidatus Termititenax persephonae]